MCLCLSIDLFGVLAEKHYPYTVIGGWSLDPDHLVIAITRLFYPSFMGLLLSRMFTGADDVRKVLSLDKFRLRGGFWWCSFAIIVLLSVPVWAVLTWSNCGCTAFTTHCPEGYENLEMKRVTKL